MAPARRLLVSLPATFKPPSIWVQQRVPLDILTIWHQFTNGAVLASAPNRAPLVGVVFKRRDAAAAAVKTFPPIYKEYGGGGHATTGQLYPPHRPGV
jgi:hypothetical protein